MARCDVERFFDSIDPAVLGSKLSPFIDGSSLRFLDRILRTRALSMDGVLEPVAGIPQGSPLSPILANLYLNDLDHKIHGAYSLYIRYCDDMIAVGPDETSVQTAVATIQQELTQVGT